MESKPQYQYVAPGVTDPSRPLPPELQHQSDSAPNGYGYSQNPYVRQPVMVGQPIQDNYQPVYMQPMYIQPQPQMYSAPSGMGQPQMYTNAYNTQLLCRGQTKGVQIYCQTWGRNTKTKTSWECGQKIWTYSCLLWVFVLLGCPPCCCLPWLIPSCYEYRHSCSECGSYVGNSMTGTMDNQNYY